MFDLETAIAGWKRTFLAREGAQPAQADELEDHVREQIASLRALARPGPTALSEEESFLIATRRLGAHDALVAEFARCDPAATWRRRWIWMLCGYLVLQIAVSLVWQLAGLAVVLASDLGRVVGIAFYAAAVIGGSLAVVGVARSFARSQGGVPSRIVRGPRSNAGIVALTLLAMAATLLVNWVGPAVLGRFVDSSTLFGLMGGRGGPDPIVLQFGSALTWIMPFVALAWLLRRELRGSVREHGIEARG